MASKLATDRSFYIQCGPYSTGLISIDKSINISRIERYVQYYFGTKLLSGYHVQFYSRKAGKFFVLDDNLLKTQYNPFQFDVSENSGSSGPPLNHLCLYVVNDSVGDFRFNTATENISCNVSFNQSQNVAVHESLASSLSNTIPNMSTSVFNTCSLNDVNNGGDSAASQESIEKLAAIPHIDRQTLPTILNNNSQTIPVDPIQAEFNRLQDEFQQDLNSAGISIDDLCLSPVSNSDTNDAYHATTEITSFKLASDENADALWDDLFGSAASDTNKNMSSAALNIPNYKDINSDGDVLQPRTKDAIDTAFITQQTFSTKLINDKSQTFLVGSQQTGYDSYLDFERYSIDANTWLEGLGSLGVSDADESVTYNLATENKSCNFASNQNVNDTWSQLSYPPNSSTTESMIKQSESVPIYNSDTPKDGNGFDPVSSPGTIEDVNREPLNYETSHAISNENSSINRAVSQQNITVGRIFFSHDVKSNQRDTHLSDVFKRTGQSTNNASTQHKKKGASVIQGNKPNGDRSQVLPKIQGLQQFKNSEYTELCLFSVYETWEQNYRRWHINNHKKFLLEDELKQNAEGKCEITLNINDIPFTANGEFELKAYLITLRSDDEDESFLYQLDEESTQNLHSAEHRPKLKNNHIPPIRILGVLKKANGYDWNTLFLSDFIESSESCKKRKYSNVGSEECAGEPQSKIRKA